MLNQSVKYHAALYESDVVQSSITGQIITTAGEVFYLSDDDIIPGSLSKNNKCVNGNSFELGSVFQGELNVTLRKAFDRYKLMDASISFVEHRYLQDGSTEDVNIGKFYIASPERSKKLTTIKAIDSMGKLDIDIADDIVGRPYDLLLALSEQCGLELAQTEAEVDALPNGRQLFSVYADTTETYRDMVAYIGMMTGTFATITTDDKLMLKAYAPENCLEVPVGKREYGSTVIADYVTYYKGIVARFIAAENYAPYEYVDSTIAGGLILDLGDIPIVRGLPEEKKNMLKNLFEVIKQIHYVPAEFSLVTSDAALELGDRIGIEGEDIVTYVTSYDWVYHGSEKIKGVGDNPRLKASGDQTQKQMADLEAKVNAKDVIVRTYTNLKALSVKDTKAVEIISINFASVVNAKPIFLATIPVIMSLDGYVVLTYHLDGVQLPEDTLRMYLARGEHFLTITNHLEMEADKRLTLTVKMQTAYHESDTRQQAARIASIEDYINTGTYTQKAVDTTPPAATIPKGAIRAVLYAQGLAGTDMWDGTINVAEYVSRIAVEDIVPAMRTVTVSAMADTQIPMGSMIAVAVSQIEVPMDLFEITAI